MKTKIQECVLIKQSNKKMSNPSKRIAAVHT